jgi:hypothetical protein
MGKRKVEIEIDSYGRYSEWDRNSKELPKLIEFTNTILAEEGAEFGMVLHIKKGKGTKLDYSIQHPPIKDDHGEYMPDFTGEHYVNYNDYKFFIGDCIWNPVEEKTGKWTVSVSFEGEKIAEKTFNVVKSD